MLFDIIKKLYTVSVFFPSLSSSSLTRELMLSMVFMPSRHVSAIPRKKSFSRNNRRRSANLGGDKKRLSPPYSVFADAKPKAPLKAVRKTRLPGKRVFGIFAFLRCEHIDHRFHRRAFRRRRQSYRSNLLECFHLRGKYVQWSR